MESFRLLYPPGHSPQGPAMPDFAFLHTLQIDRMVTLPRESARGLPDLELEQFVSCDEAVLAWRGELFRELSETPALAALVEDAIPLIRDVYELRKVVKRTDGSLESGLASTRYLEMYLELTELFHTRLAGITPQSDAVQLLKQQITARCESEDYRSLQRQLAAVEQQLGRVKSITLGVNLDGSLQVREAGLLALHDAPYRQGSLMDRLTGRAANDPMVCMSAFAPVAKAGREEDKAALNAAVHRALSAVFARTIRSWEPAIAQYFHDETKFFIDLLDDLRFIAAALRFLRSLHEAGCVTCRPRVAPMGERTTRLTNLRNPMLALTAPGETVVANDLTFAPDGRFYLITGPNHGGKSIFCYAVGMAQALFQLGLPVPADSATLSPVSGIYTHFPTSDENNYGKGRLESECARLSEIMHVLRPTDLLLMDESFSSTSLLEGSYIAGEVLRAVAVIGCSGLYVTHIHELTQHVAEYNATPGATGCIDNLVAQMQSVADGTRSYRVLRTTPDGLSYARDIARKYGLSCEEILGREV